MGGLSDAVWRRLERDIADYERQTGKKCSRGKDIERAEQWADERRSRRNS